MKNNNKLNIKKAAPHVFFRLKEREARREPASALDFFTHDALNTLVAMQESFRQEQR
jgi:hypothetical protein